MNIRGDSEGSPIKLIVVSIIAVVILFLIIPSPLRAGVIDTVKNIIPVYNTSVELSVEDEIVRYHVVDGSLSFFDGSSWQPILPNSELRINDKYIESDSLKDSFVDYYYGERYYSARYCPGGLSYNVETGESPENELSLDKMPDDTFLPLRYHLIGMIKGTNAQELDLKGTWKVENIPGGTVKIWLQSSRTDLGVESRRVYGELLVTSKDKVFFVDQSDNIDNTKYEQVEGLSSLTSEVRTWRNSLLAGGYDESTMDAPYKDENKVDKIVTVQPELYDNEYLMIRLDKPVEVKEPIVPEELQGANSRFQRVVGVETENATGAVLYVDGEQTDFYFERDANNPKFIYSWKDDDTYVAKIENSIIHVDLSRVASSEGDRTVTVSEDMLEVLKEIDGMNFNDISYITAKEGVDVC